MVQDHNYRRGQAEPKHCQEETDQTPTKRIKHRQDRVTQDETDRQGQRNQIKIRKRMRTEEELHHAMFFQIIYEHHDQDIRAYSTLH